MRIHFEGLNREELARRETLFHVANGYVGMRASFEEGVPEGLRSIRGTYLNGFYDSAPIHYEERLHGFARTQQSIVNVIDTQGMDIRLGGEAFSCFTGTLHHFEQELDLERGVYTRTVERTSPEGRRSLLVFERLASFEMQQLALIRVRVTPLDWSGRVEITSSQHGDVTQDFDPNDPRKASIGRKMMDITQASREGSVMLMAARTTRSGLFMASAVAHRWQGHFGLDVQTSREVSLATLACGAARGEEVSVTKYCVFTDSRRDSDPATLALSLMDRACAQPFSYWAGRQAEYLAGFWRKAAAGVQGDEALNAALAWSMYTLLASAGKDGIGNIASKGLSGEGYEGHYFWDTEIYMFPFFLLTSPDLAKNLLDSRAAMLGEAKEHAREMGHETGALYAWRTITGSECSAYFPSGSAQYHINGAVAHAFLSYWRAAGDLHYMAQKGAQVLIETARLWMDAGHWLEGSFRIDSVTGPDEYSCVVNNNYYTNRIAQHHLRGTQALCRELEEAGLLVEAVGQTGITQEELDSFLRAADAMYLPFDEALGISAQDDAFLKKQVLDIAAIPEDRFPLLMHYHPLFLYRHQVCKQADTVLSHFLFEEGEDEEVIKNSYDYYERLTTHDSSLSECVFSMMAARTGQVDKAYRYYRGSAALDLEDTHGNTADGIHAANMGGCWMGIAFGFGGLRLHQDGPVLRPCLPKEMAGYHFTFLWRGSRVRVEVVPGQVRLTLLEGPAIQFDILGREYLLKDELTLPLNG